MALLAKQTVGLAGLAPTYVAANVGGDTFGPGNNVCIHVKNGSAGALTVTLVTPGNVVGQAVADVAVSVPAGGERLIGPLPGSLFARAADGLGDITYSGVTSLTVAVFELDPNVAS